MPSQPPPVFPGGSGYRGAVVVTVLALIAVSLGAIAWLAWRGTGARTLRTEPTSVAGAATPDRPGTSTAHAATPSIAAPPAAAPPAAALAELGAPAVAAILATATAGSAAGGGAAGGDLTPDPLAPVRAIEADGYVDAARQVYRQLAESPGDTGLAAAVALARLALAEGDHAGALAMLEAAAARSAGKDIPLPAAAFRTETPATADLPTAETSASARQTDGEAAGGDAPSSAAAGDVDAAADTGGAGAVDAADADGAADSDRPAPAPTSVQPLAETLGLLAGQPAGLYLYGLALEGLHRPRGAAEAFERYGAALPAMADVAAMAAGNNLFGVGDYEAALDAFTRARDAAGGGATASLAALRRGNALLRLGPPDAAVPAYEEAFDRADSDAARAQALAGLIAAHVAAGRDDRAREVRLRLVRELPSTSLAVAAMDRLAEAGTQVAPAEEAAVRAGNGDYWPALQIMAAAIAADPQHPSSWELDIVRWYRSVGEQARVVEAADAFLAERAEDPLAPEAAWERARALARLGQDRDAATAYGELADRWPRSERAAEALWQRAWLVLALDGPASAVDAFEAVAARYPASDNARDARFRAGLSAWRTGNLPRAAELWTAVSENGGGLDRARAEYWLGRAASDGGAADIAFPHWQAAAAADPTGYYGLRAAERLGRSSAPAAEATGRGQGGGADDSATSRDSGGQAAGDAAALRDADFDRTVAAWMATWKPEITAAGLEQARARLAAQPEVQRAAAWLAIGDRHAALRSLRAVNGRSWGDPATQVVLAREAARLGLFEIATSAAGGAIGAAPPERRLGAPAALGRLAYPDAFGELVRAEAEANDVPLALLFALIRQESRFEPTARSGAGATGLTQVMPATGEGLAGALGEPDFAVDKLYRPYYALRFGAFLAGRHLRQYDEQALPALAAYNAGGGNAARWWEASGGDVDLFAELIDYRETRLYVRLVAEHAAHYRRLYGEMR